MTEHKYKEGDHLWYATQFCVIEVTVMELTTFIDGALSYTVEGKDPQSRLTAREEVTEGYLFKTKLEALHDSLRQNDISQTIVNNNIRNEVAFSDKLQASSQHMRKLLYEEQIVEYMKNKQPNKETK
jgi:hypothetical protein